MALPLRPSPTLDRTEPAHTEELASARRFVHILGRHVILVLLPIVLVPSFALGFSLRATKQYKATASLLFRDPGFDQKLFGSSVQPMAIDRNREAATNLRLVSLPRVTARAAEILNRDPSSIRRKVEVKPQGQADVLSVSAADPDPTAAAKIANAVAQQYILFRQRADRSKINESLALVRDQFAALDPDAKAGQQGRSLKTRGEELRILATLQTGNAELVQPATPPESPSSPRPTRNVLLGLFLGVLLGVGTATLRDRLDRRLRDHSDAEAILERPTLAVIPQTQALAAGGEGLLLSGVEYDAFSTLRTNLRFFGVDHSIRSILITSSAPGDGKSTVARYLAAIAATSDVRVVLVEADIRRPTLHGLHGLEDFGLTDVLTGSRSVSEATQQIPIQLAVPVDGGRTLDVIAAGPVPPNPADLLQSARMHEVLRELEEAYELVVLDTSPVSMVPDAISLMVTVSAVVIVVREGKSTRPGILHLRKQLDNLRVNPLGLVINGADLLDHSGYGRYEYSYRPPDEKVNRSPANGRRTSASRQPASQQTTASLPSNSRRSR